MEGREGALRRSGLDVNPGSFDVLKKLVKQALAGVNYLLTIAVSVIVIAVVIFRALVAESGVTNTLPTTTLASGPAPTLPVASPVTEQLDETFNCSRISPERSSGRPIILVFYHCGPEDSPLGEAWVYREVPDDGPLLTLTVEALVGGPTVAERADGFRSLFSPATAGALITVASDAGHVVVDFHDLGPLPSLAIDEGRFFLADLNNTLFEHEIVEAVEYRIEGSCEAFWAYFEDAGCKVIDRAVWRNDPAAARG